MWKWYLCSTWKKSIYHERWDGEGMFVKNLSESPSPSRPCMFFNTFFGFLGSWFLALLMYFLSPPPTGEKHNCSSCWPCFNLLAMMNPNKYAPDLEKTTEENYGYFLKWNLPSFPFFMHNFYSLATMQHNYDWKIFLPRFIWAITS